MSKIKLTKTIFLFSFIAFVFFVSPSFPQTQKQLNYYAERIEFGDEEVKRNALFDLRNFKSESASRIAIPALKDHSAIVRATATHTVVFLPKDNAAKVLSPLLKDKSIFVRRETAYALGNVGNKNSVTQLINLLENDKYREVKTACVVALGQIGDSSAIESLTKVLQKKRKKKELFLRRSAARAIGNIARTLQRENKPIITPESFLPEKFKILKRPKYPRLLKYFPIFIKANLRLISILQNSKETDDVLREAAFALGEIGDSSSISILKAKLNSKDYYLVEISKESLRKIYQNINVTNSDG